MATVANAQFQLYAQKSLYWEKHQALLLADLHLGKVTHFRRAGIPVPARANDQNIERLLHLIQTAHPQRVIFLGDLFHSHYNTEWEVFGELIRHFSAVSFELVLGNHDVMSALQYERHGIQVYDHLMLDSFLLTHHPLEDIPAGCYNLAGHIHPGVQLKGKGRQSVTFPCFYFGKQQGFLPAFGMFTGMARIRPRKTDQVFVIAEETILPVL